MIPLEIIYIMSVFFEKEIRVSATGISTDIFIFANRYKKGNETVT